MFNTDIEILQEKADEFDTLRYKEIYDLIEDYLSKEMLLLWSTIHVNRLYTVFSDNPLKHCNDLSNKLAIITKYVEMKTDVPYKSFSIMVNMKHMVKFYIIDNYKDVSLFKLLKYYKKDKFKIMPAEIELIQIYWKKYQMEEVDDTYLINKFEITGGNCKKDINYEELKKMLGHLSCVYLNSNKIQVITETDNTLNEVKTILSKYNLTYRMQDHDIKLPIDFRLKRKTIYTLIKGKEAPIIDIFNSAEYELIPYIYSNGIKIAHPFVQLKFLLIDLWINEMRYGINQITEQRRDKKRNNIIKNIKNIKSNNDYSMDNYEFYGTFYQERIAVKNLYQQSSFYPYIPFNYFTSHKEYRKI